ncbi:hypothetical protein DAH55_20775, partial [Sphingomonas koreensis]
PTIVDRRPSGQRLMILVQDRGEICAEVKHDQRDLISQDGQHIRCVGERDQQGSLVTRLRSLFC